MRIFRAGTAIKLMRIRSDAKAGHAQWLKDLPALQARRSVREAQARAAGVPILDLSVDRPIAGAASATR